MDFSLLCFDTTINPYRLYGRETQEGVTMTDTEPLQFMQLFSFFISFVSSLPFSVRHTICFQKKRSAAANFNLVDD